MQVWVNLNLNKLECGFALSAQPRRVETGVEPKIFELVGHTGCSSVMEECTEDEEHVEEVLWRPTLWEDKITICHWICGKQGCKLSVSLWINR